MQVARPYITQRTMQVLQKNAVQGLAVRTRSLFAPRLPSTVARNQTPFQASKGSTAFVATTSVVPGESWAHPEGTLHVNTGRRLHSTAPHFTTRLITHAFSLLPKPVLPAFVCLASATDDATYTEEDLSREYTA